MAPTTHEKSEWSRVAAAAYDADRPRTGLRFTVAASVPDTYDMGIQHFDRLMGEYRAWLVFNEFAAEA